MSQSRNCLIIETAPGRWFYVLEHTHADPHAWSWLVQADAYGPFADADVAFCHLSDHHSNPGGHSSQPFTGKCELSPELDKLIASAIAPRPGWRPKANELAELRAHRARQPLYDAMYKASSVERGAGEVLLAACKATTLPPSEAVQDAILAYQSACAAHMAAEQALRVSQGVR